MKFKMEVLKHKNINCYIYFSYLDTTNNKNAPHLAMEGVLLFRLLSQRGSMVSDYRDSAVATTFSTVKPNSLNSSSAGADSPKVRMPMILPPKPTYLYQ